MKSNDQRDHERILTRRVAKLLDEAGLKAVTGGGRITYAGGKPSDHGQQF